MAKYAYKYACGHGIGSVVLYGKEDDRRRKLEWYGDNFVCPECFKKQKEEEDAAAPMTASLAFAICSDVVMSVQVQGRLKQNKEALKEAGYRWQDEMTGGLLHLLSKPKLVLQKTAVVGSIEEIKKIALAWKEELFKLGYTITRFPNHLEELSVREHFKHQAEKKRKEEERIAEEKAKAMKKQETIKKLDPEPKPPAWLKEIQENKKYWNGKFYSGRKKGRCRIYVDNEETSVSTEEKEQYEKWCNDLKEWKEFWQD